MSTLESRVRAALEAEADRAPTPAPWSPTPQVAKSNSSSGSRSSWAIAATGVAATAVSIVGLLAIATRDTTPSDNPAPASQPLKTVWAPPGEEFRLEDLGPAEYGGAGWVGLAPLTRLLGVPNHPDLSFTSGVGYFAGESIEEFRCIGSDGGGAVCYSPTRPGPAISVTSSVDNGIGEFDVWTWSNVPPHADYVVYAQDDATRWQAPILGVAAFPNRDGFNSAAVAYTNEGVEVARVDSDVLEVADQQQSDAWPIVADLDETQATEITEVMQTTAIDCLTTAGADFDNGLLGQLNSDDVNDVWSDCVATSRTAVEDWLEDNGIQFYQSEPGATQVDGLDFATDVSGLAVEASE